MPYDYEKLYAEQHHALGEPFPEVVKYFKAIPAPKRVLDIGAGQGRDAIFIAKLGHYVHAVDLSPSGLEQLANDTQDLNVTTEVADLMAYEPKETFDVILIDRTLHMIGVSAGNAALDRLAPHLSSGGEFYILDEKSNIPSFTAHLTSLGFAVTNPSQTSLTAKKPQ